MYRRYPAQGITLVEMIIVIAIIGILASIVIPNAERYMRRGRDGKRVADMKIIETTLEAFRMDTGHYPSIDDCIGAPAVNTCVARRNDDRGECFGDQDVAWGPCNSSGILEQFLGAYIHGGAPRDPLYFTQPLRASNQFYYYAYDTLEDIDWCDNGAPLLNTANDIDAPVFGVMRFETQPVRDMVRVRATCDTTTAMDLDLAEYNVALRGM